jgi:transposase
MAAPLSDYTIEEQRTVVRFLWAEGLNSSPDVGTACSTHMHQRQTYEWIERFKEGRTSVTDESRPGRPSTSRTDQHIQRVDALIREDRRLTLARVAVRLAW